MSKYNRYDEPGQTFLFDGSLLDYIMGRRDDMPAGEGISDEYKLRAAILRQQRIRDEESAAKRSRFKILDH